MILWFFDFLIFWLFNFLIFLFFFFFNCLIFFYFLFLGPNWKYKWRIWSRIWRRNHWGWWRNWFFQSQLWWFWKVRLHLCTILPMCQWYSGYHHLSRFLFNYSIDHSKNPKWIIYSMVEKLPNKKWDLLSRYLQKETFKTNKKYLSKWLFRTKTSSWRLYQVRKLLERQSNHSILWSWNSFQSN